MKHIVPVFALIVGIAMLVLVVVPAAQIAQARYSRLQPEEHLVSRYYKSVAKLKAACDRTANIPAKAAYCRRLGINDPAAVLSLAQGIRKTAGDGYIDIATATVNKWETGAEASLKLLER